MGEGVIQFGTIFRRLTQVPASLCCIWLFTFYVTLPVQSQESSKDIAAKAEVAGEATEKPSAAAQEGGDRSSSSQAGDKPIEGSAPSESQADKIATPSADKTSAAANTTKSDRAAEGSEGARQGTLADQGIDPTLKDLLSLATDYTTKIGKREMPGYWGLVDLVMDKSVAELVKNSKRNPRYNDFYSNPSQHRGELVSTTLHLRRVITYPVDPALGHKATELHELWGWTDESKAWVYCIVTPKLPPGFPKDGDFNRDVEVAGYFFKMQGYQPGGAAPNAKNLIAPLIIGRVDEVRKPEVPIAQFNNLTILFVGVFALLFFLRLMLRLRSSVSSIGQTHIEVRRRLRRERPEIFDELPDIERPSDAEKLEEKRDVGSQS